MISHNQFMERIGWATAFWALVCLGLVLSGVKVEAQVNCRIVTEAFPAMQISMVSKECWETPDKIVAVVPAPVIPKAKPAIVKVLVKKVAKKRKSPCGSKRQKWRTLANGYKKYRCVA